MHLPESARARIEAAAGARVVGVHALAGGCIGDVRRIDLDDGRAWVAKLGGPDSGLALEGFMLRHLAKASPLPVPAVHDADDALLVMDCLPAGGPLDAAAQVHAADLVAQLHGVTGPHFGFSCDTVIGGLAQPNPLTDSWRDFFRDHRLLHMAGEAARAGQLPGSLLGRIEGLAAQLDRWLDEPPAASLVHGDMWAGNVLCQSGRVTGFVDPAIYHADPEIELAFTTLFNTFGETFFARYNEHRPLAPGFFEERRDLYNLYPLLVHVRLFGGSYVASVDKTLGKFGC